MVIYSMTSSSSKDAPHGMNFFYNLNRLNVATSRLPQSPTAGRNADLPG